MKIIRPITWLIHMPQIDWHYYDHRRSNRQFLHHDLLFSCDDPTLIIAMEEPYPILYRMENDSSDKNMKMLFESYKMDLKYHSSKYPIIDRGQIWDFLSFAIWENDLKLNENSIIPRFKFDHYDRLYDPSDRLMDGTIDPTNHIITIQEENDLDLYEWIAFDYDFDKGIDDNPENGGKATLYFAFERPDHFILDYNRAFAFHLEYNGWNRTYIEKGSFGRDLENIITMLKSMNNDFSKFEDYLENLTEQPYAGHFYPIERNALLKALMLPKN